YFSTVRGMKKKLREPDIVQIVNETIKPHLEELGLAENYNAEQLRLHFRNKREVPFVYRDDVDFSKFARYAEGGTELPGVELSQRPVRHYRFGALAAHLLGYVGPVRNVQEQEDIGQFTFY